MNRKYFVVYAFNSAEDDFVIEGIFSKEADAIEFKDERMADPSTCGAGSIQPISMPDIMTLLTAQRMGLAAETIERLVSRK